jgi:hypothetical protein
MMDRDSLPPWDVEDDASYNRAVIVKHFYAIDNFTHHETIYDTILDFDVAVAHLVECCRGNRRNKVVVHCAMWLQRSIDRPWYARGCSVTSAMKWCDLMECLCIPNAWKTGWC